jgi:hypothetical protein
MTINPYTFNIIASVRHGWLYECTVRAMRKQLKPSSDGGDSGSKNYKQACGGAYGGVWRSLHSAGGGVWSQTVCFVSVSLAEIWFESPWRYFHI